MRTEKMTKPDLSSLFGYGILVGAGALALWASVHEARVARPKPPAKQQSTARYMQYVVTASEWPNDDATYCAIAQRFDLQPPEVDTMLKINGSTNTCVDGTAHVPIGAEVDIALSSDGSNYCGSPDVPDCRETGPDQ
jgi:hypothetical protein